METVTSADGTPIAYERTGSGPPLVLVHGATADHTRWGPVRPGLAERFTVYAVDRRGRAESGDADEYALEREFEDVAAVVDAADGPAVLLGHSFGATCALEAALRTDDLRALVLYEPPLPVGGHDPDAGGALAAMQRLAEKGERERALVLFFREVVGVSAAELDAVRSAPDWQARVDRVHTVVREVRARRGYEFDPERFATLTTPTLLAGSESGTLHEDATSALDTALPNSRVVVLDGEGHAGMSTAPDRFVDAVLGFVRSLD